MVHRDSTSFSVEGAYAVEEEGEETSGMLIRITYGYSRDHRTDLSQWQLSLATTTSGVPLGLQLLDGNASDRATLARAARRGRLPVPSRAGRGTDLRCRKRPLQQREHERTRAEGRVVDQPCPRNLDAGQGAGGRGDNDLARDQGTPLVGAGGACWRANGAVDRRAKRRGGGTADGQPPAPGGAGAASMGQARARSGAADIRL